LDYTQEKENQAPRGTWTACLWVWQLKRHVRSWFAPASKAGQTKRQVATRLSPWSAPGLKAGQTERRGQQPQRACLQAGAPAPQPNHTPIKLCSPQ